MWRRARKEGEEVRRSVSRVNSEGGGRGQRAVLRDVTYFSYNLWPPLLTTRVYNPLGLLDNPFEPLVALDEAGVEVEASLSEWMTSDGCKWRVCW